MPKVQIALALLILFFIVFSRIGYVDAVRLLVFCVGFTVVSDVVFAFVRRKSLFTTPFSAVVTGLIFTLIVDTGATWYQICFMAVFAMTIKNFVRFKGRHVFNPAASGLVIGFFVFGLQPSWWGPTLFQGGFSNPSNIAIFIVLLAIGYVSAIRLKRYIAVVTYLLLSAILPMLITQNFSVDIFLTSILSVGTLFFALLMLPEPMTSPVKPMRQVLYGGFVSSMVLVLVFFVIGNNMFGDYIPDSSLVALLLGNAIFFTFR